MTQENDINRAKQLLSDVQKYNIEYFSSQPSISDEEFDEIEDALRQLLKLPYVQTALKMKDVPLGYADVPGTKVKHLVPILSLDKLKMTDKSYEKKLRTFMKKYTVNPADERLQQYKNHWRYEYKLDGITVVIYRTSKGVTYVTRGAKQVGLDITHHLSQIPAIHDSAMKLPEGAIARGESVISIDNFNKLNQATIESGQLVEKSQSIIDYIDDMIATQSISESDEAELLELKDNIISQNFVLRTKHFKALKSFYKGNKDAYDLINTFQLDCANVFSNSRNLVSATLQSKDSNLSVERNVELIMYEILNYEQLGLQLESDVDKLLRDANFNVVESQTFTSIDDAVEFLLGDVDVVRNSSPYDIDGFVLKPELKLINPESNHNHIKGHIALKFASAGADTKLLDIEWTTGHGGVQTPKAIVEPVIIGGVTISKASLSSWNVIQELGIKIGDEVRLVRSGDVIPQIIQVYEDRRTGEEIDIEQPKDTYLDGANLYSTLTVEAPLDKQINKFLQSIDVQGLGLKKITQLVDEGIITSISDATNLQSHEREVLQLNRWSDKSFNSIIESIANAQDTATLDKFLSGLELNGIGATAAAKLYEHFGTLDNMLSDEAKLIEFAENESSININGLSTLKDMINDADKYQLIKSAGRGFKLV